MCGAGEACERDRGDRAEKHPDKIPCKKKKKASQKEEEINPPKEKQQNTTKAKKGKNK